MAEEIRRVTRFFRSEAGAVVLWVIGALLLAAALSPWVYQGGKWLGAQEGLPAFFAWLGAAAARSEFPRFFNRTLMLSALLLLPLMLRRVRAIRRAGPAVELAPVKLPWKFRWLHFFTGLVIAASLLWALGVALEAGGAFFRRDETPSFSKFLTKAVLPAVGASLLEEWLFRGLLLGLWLRFAKPAAAALGVSLVFAFVHFLAPPDGAEIANPASPGAGFLLLGRILLHFTEPQFFVTDFATLFVVGLILAYARLRTGGLSFSVGLHAGWVLAFKAFNLLHNDDPASPLSPWGVGENLRSGVLPLVTLAITGLLCHFAIRRLPR